MNRFPAAKDRISLRQIAEAGGVSLMTVSLALRESTTISAPTRERIRKLAYELGYQPDPELSRLMTHLRFSREEKGKPGVAIIDFHRPNGLRENFYIRYIREGASKRAKELGFDVTFIRSNEYDFDLRQILEVVRDRGIEGVLFLPSVLPLQLDESTDWSNLSVAATSNSILAPRFHSAVPHQFANMMQLLENIRRRGYQRVCAVFDEFFDERTGHNFTAAVNWHRHGRRILTVPARLSPEKKRELVAEWIKEESPDVVFAQASDSVTAALPLLPKSIRPFVVGLGTKAAFDAYVDEQPDLVGSAGIDLLAGMMHCRETGIPENPRTTMIDCQLHLDRSGSHKNKYARA